MDPEGTVVSFPIRFLYGRIAAALLNVLDRGDDSTSPEQMRMDESTYWDDINYHLEIEQLFEDVQKLLDGINKDIDPDAPC